MNDIKKLFPYLANNEYNKIKYNIETLMYITPFDLSNIISSIIISNIPHYIDFSKITLYEFCGCIGCDTITFAKHFEKIITTEINNDFFIMLENNLSVYDIKNVDLLNKSCLDIYKNMSNADVFYIDPPWGGKDYKKEKNLRLKIDNEYIDEIINNIINNIKIIVLKLPKNYNIKELYKLTKHNNVSMYIYKLRKMNIIVYNNWF